MRRLLLALALCLSFPACRAADDATPTPTPEATPTPETVSPAPPPRLPSSKSVLTIHKRLLSPAWGRVVQYRRIEKTAFAEKDRETMYEFVLQDDAGIVRVATYHESADGAGYWEVFVWDRP